MGLIAKIISQIQGYPAFTNYGHYKDIRNTCKRPYKHGFVSCFIPLIWQHITYYYSDSPLDTLLKHCKNQQQTQRRGWCRTNDLHYCLLQQLSEYYATIMVAWAECCVLKKVLFIWIIAIHGSFDIMWWFKRANDYLGFDRQQSLLCQTCLTVV